MSIYSPYGYGGFGGFGAYDAALGYGYGVPFGNYMMPPPFIGCPRRRIQTIKRGVIFTLDCKETDDDDYIILASVSIPKLGMFGSAQFVQDCGECVNKQVTLAASPSIKARKQYRAEPLIFEEGMLVLTTDDVDYPNKVLYTAELKINFKFDREIRRECYQVLTVFRNPWEYIC